MTTTSFRARKVGAAILAVVATVGWVQCTQVCARPIESYYARFAVTGWLRAGTQPLGTALGRAVTSIETHYDSAGEPLYYVAHLEPYGFVVLPADDEVEPIIAFSSASTYDPSPQNPLATLLQQDLTRRVTSARAEGREGGITLYSAGEHQYKWHALIERAADATDMLTPFAITPESDIRVDPLVQSTWAQGVVCNANLFNYYTPGDSVAGCVAITMAQLMRYYQYPAQTAGEESFTILYQEHHQTAWLRGGDGQGGPYHWFDMPLEPDCQTTETQRQAIGALCYDAGISVSTEYTYNSSGADVFKVKNALTQTFGFANAAEGYNEGGEIGANLQTMINPNLDADCPVILGITGQTGHAVLADGYGYDEGTIYHHLNLGWSGWMDTWYNLPEVLYYDTIMACIYNIFTTNKGEIISGRVTDEFGTPLAYVQITARISPAPRVGGFYNATTNERGIYALVGVPSQTSFVVTAAKEHLQFQSRTVTTGRSKDLTTQSGNKWQIDFVGTLAGDCNGDGRVDLLDFAMLASAWRSQPGNPSWNAACDTSIEADQLVNSLDLEALVLNWLVAP